jgi:pimeloyl-ACP methyl ester carboxylesterase
MPEDRVRFPSLRGVVGSGLDRLDRLRRRLSRRPAEGLVRPGPASPLPARRGRFHRDHVLATYKRGSEHEGRLYNYVLYPGDEALCVHFSAFFGEWGEERRNRSLYQGYFHRLRMFWPLTRFRFLFLCDTFGADRNGTYYKGEGGEFFVERAMAAIIDAVQDEVGVDPNRVVMLGSSMGATAALRLALERSAAGAVAVSPHIDLDLAARFQGRTRHVAAMLGADDVESPRHYPVTREVRTLAETAPLGPRIAIQSMEDDRGVHSEQVIPLVERWQERGGEVDCDFRPEGGHTSDHATAEWFEQRILWCLDEHLD